MTNHSGTEAHAQNCRFDSLHSYTLDAWWILIIASLMLLELLSSLMPSCGFSLRKLPMTAFMTYNMDSYLLFYYILRGSRFLVLSVCTFKRLILSPREAHLEGEKACSCNMHVAHVQFCCLSFLEVISYLTIQNMKWMVLGQLDILTPKNEPQLLPWNTHKNSLNIDVISTNHIHPKPLLTAQSEKTLEETRQLWHTLLSPPYLHLPP